MRLPVVGSVLSVHLHNEFDFIGFYLDTAGHSLLRDTTNNG